MKKIDLGQTITIFANIGVIAGIVFLAFELQQNNNLLTTQARATLMAARLSQQEAVSRNVGGLAEILVKVSSGDSLTDLERYQISVHRSLVLMNYSVMFREMVEGPLTERDIPIGQWAVDFTGDPGLRALWDLVKHRIFEPDFISFVDERVLTFDLPD